MILPLRLSFDKINLKIKFKIILSHTYIQYNLPKSYDYLKTNLRKI